jgi:uncharacterized protein YggU (UPF0235/DUF167 family)
MCISISEQLFASKKKVDYCEGLFLSVYPCFDKTMDYRIRVTLAKKEGVVLLRDGRLAVAVMAPRKEGRANERACELIGAYFHVPASLVSIVKGHQSATKVVRVIDK